MTDGVRLEAVLLRGDKMYITRRIFLPELRRLRMAHPDFAKSGWAVVHLGGDKEAVVEWYADRHAAVERASALNDEGASS